jgi:hypothetical protein
MAYHEAIKVPDFSNPASDWAMRKNGMLGVNQAAVVRRLL